MDAERWPDEIANQVAAISACPRCSNPRGKGLAITVSFQAPVWNILAICLKCGLKPWWQFVAPGLVPKAPEPEKIPLPAWVKDLVG